MKINSLAVAMSASTLLLSGLFTSAQADVFDGENKPTGAKVEQTVPSQEIIDSADDTTTAKLNVFSPDLKTSKIVITDLSGPIVYSEPVSLSSLESFLVENNYKPKDFETEIGEGVKGITFPLKEDLYLFKKTYDGKMERVALSFPVEKIETSALEKGETEIVEEGEEGVALITSVETLALADVPKVNSKASGKPVSTVQESITVVKPPLPKIVRVGVGPTYDDATKDDSVCDNGSAVPAGVDGNIAAIHQDICALFPEVTTYGTFRSYCTYTCDHHNGKAVDIMVSGKLGWEIAHYLERNYARYDIHNMIYEQSIWATYRQYWDPMSDRGSITANHYDHVHVSVY